MHMMPFDPTPSIIGRELLGPHMSRKVTQVWHQCLLMSACNLLHYVSMLTVGGAV